MEIRFVTGAKPASMATLGGSTPPTDASMTVFTRTPVAPTVTEKSLVSLGTGSPMAQSVVIQAGPAVLVDVADDEVLPLELDGDDELPQAARPRTSAKEVRTGTAS